MKKRNITVCKLSPRMMYPVLTKMRYKMSERLENKRQDEGLEEFRVFS